MRFENKVVFITGGAKGLGREMAKAFLAEGASVAVNGRNPEAITKFEEEFKGQPVDAAALLALQRRAPVRPDWRLVPAGAQRLDRGNHALELLGLTDLWARPRLHAADHITLAGIRALQWSADGAWLHFLARPQSDGRTSLFRWSPRRARSEPARGRFLQILWYIPTQAG